MPQLDYRRLMREGKIPSPTRTTPQEPQKPFSLSGEFVRTLGTGARGFAQSAIDLPKIFPGVDYDVTVPQFVDEPQTGVGRFASFAVQWAIPYTGAVRALSLAAKLSGLTRAPKLLQVTRGKPKAPFERPTPIDIRGRLLSTTTKRPVDEIFIPGKQLTRNQKFAKWAAGGAIADFVAFAPNDPNLSRLIANMTEDTRIPVINAISEMLATDADDPAALNRFRNVLEGLGLGLLVPQILRGLAKGISLTGKGVVAATPQPLRTRAAELREWTIQKGMDPARRVATIVEEHAKQTAEALKSGIKSVGEKVGYGKESKKILDAWQERRMFVASEHYQTLIRKDGWYNRNIITGNFSRISGHVSFKEIQKMIGPDHEEYFKEYVLHKQAQQHLKSKKGSDWTQEEVDAFFKNFDENIHPKVKSLMLKGEKALQDFNSAALKFLRNEGVITKKTSDAYEFVSGKPGGERRVWIPLYKKSDDVLSEMANVLRKSPTLMARSKVHIARKKRTEEEILVKREELGDVYDNLMAGYDSMIEHAFKNRANQKLFKLIDELGDNGKKIAERAVREPTVKTYLGRVIKEAVRRTGIKDETGAHIRKLKDKDIVKIHVSEMDWHKDNIVTVWNKGVAEHWIVHDAMLIDSISAMGYQITSDFAKYAMRWGGKFKNFLTRMVTASPTFFLGTNWTRDTLSVAMLTKWMPFVDSYRGLYHQFAKTEWAKRLEVGGGTFGIKPFSEFRHGRELNAKVGKNIHNINEPKGWKKFLQTVDGFTQKFELASRTRAYQTFIKQGYSESVAAFKAREIAVDFAQHGTSTSFRILTSTVPFLNAHMQGIDRTMRALGTKRLRGAALSPLEAEEVARVWQMTISMSIVGGVLLPMAHYKSDDPKLRKVYEEIPVWMKDTNFVWVMPNIFSKEEDDYHTFLLSKPFDFGIIPTIVEKFLDEEFIESDAMVIREYIWNAALGIARSRDASMFPQIIRPFIELRLNKKHTGAPIVPKNLVGGTIAERRYYTSPTAIALADLAGNANFAPDWTKSPLELEHVLNSFFGTIGGFAMDYITDPIFREFLQMSPKAVEQPESRWPWEEGAAGLGKVTKILPIRVIGDVLTSTRSENEMYDLFQKASSVKLDFDSFKNNLDEFNRTQFKDMLKDKETKFWLAQYPMFENILNALANINSAIEVLARTKPHELEQRNKLLLEKQRITREILRVFFSQKRRQLGMAKGGPVTRNEDEMGGLPVHTEKTMQQIAANIPRKPTDLIVSSTGFKNPVTAGETQQGGGGAGGGIRLGNPANINLIQPKFAETGATNLNAPTVYLRGQELTEQGLQELLGGYINVRFKDIVQTSTSPWGEANTIVLEEQDALIYIRTLKNDLGNFQGYEVRHSNGNIEHIDNLSDALVSAANSFNAMNYPRSKNMAKGGIVERPVQGMQDGGLATEHDDAQTVRNQRIADAIEAEEGTINGFYLDSEGNWTVGIGHRVLSADWNKYNVTITLNVADLGEAPIWVEVNRDQFHKTDIKTIRVDVGTDSEREITLPSLKTIGKLIAIQAGDDVTHVRRIDGQPDVVMYTITTQPKTHADGAIYNADTATPEQIAAAREVLADDIDSWWAIDFGESLDAANLNREAIETAAAARNEPLEITEDMLTSLVQLNFQIGIYWNTEGFFNNAWAYMLAGDWGNAALEIEYSRPVTMNAAAGQVETFSTAPPDSEGREIRVSSIHGDESIWMFQTPARAQNVADNLRALAEAEAEAAALAEAAAPALAEAEAAALAEAAAPAPPPPPAVPEYVDPDDEDPVPLPAGQAGGGLVTRKPDKVYHRVPEPEEDIIVPKGGGDIEEGWENWGKSPFEPYIFTDTTTKSSRIWPPTQEQELTFEQYNAIRKLKEEVPELEKVTSMMEKAQNLKVLGKEGNMDAREQFTQIQDEIHDKMFKIFPDRSSQEITHIYTILLNIAKLIGERI